MNRILHEMSNKSRYAIKTNQPLSTNFNDEITVITFYNESSSLVRQIPQYNVLIIGGYMMANTGKDENDEY